MFYSKQLITEIGFKDEHEFVEDFCDRHPNCIVRYRPDGVVAISDMDTEPGCGNLGTTEKYDRHTALRVLQDLSSCMYPSLDLYGNKTLVIDRDKFEKIRAKYLDRKE